MGWQRFKTLNKFEEALRNQLLPGDQISRKVRVPDMDSIRSLLSRPVTRENGRIKVKVHERIQKLDLIGFDSQGVAGEDPSGKQYYFSWGSVIGFNKIQEV